jgi:hypothetical protein
VASKQLPRPPLEGSRRLPAWWVSPRGRNGETPAVARSIWPLANPTRPCPFPAGLAVTAAGNQPGMADAPRTYESPPAGSDAVGLEDFVVEIRGGDRIGTVVATVEEDGHRSIVIEQGTPPFRRDRRAVPWDDVESVDYDALIVHLRSQPSLADVPLGSEGGRADAERVTELAGAPKSGRTGDVAGPTDRSGTWFIAFASFALGMLTLLAVVMGLSHRSVDSRPAWLLLTVPVLLLLTAGVVGYRLWRSPYENRER